MVKDMDEKEFLRFIEEIIKNNKNVLGGIGTARALSQFAQILERNNFDKKYVDKVLSLEVLDKEVKELKGTCLNDELTMEELDIQIQRGKARLKREEEERRGRC